MPFLVLGSNASVALAEPTFQHPAAFHGPTCATSRAKEQSVVAAVGAEIDIVTPKRTGWDVEDRKS